LTGITPIDATEFVVMDDDEVGLPIKLGPCSNGEFVLPAPTPLAREAARRARLACEENARQTGMSRRDFLLSITGAATTLAVLAACAKEENGGQDTGGTFTVPPEATTDTTAARETLADADGFVMDVQTHFLEYDLSAAQDSFWGSGFPQAQCGEDDDRACFAVGRFLDLVLASSDTSVGVLSAIPTVGAAAPLPAEVMKGAMELAEDICGTDRLLMQGHVAPNADDDATAIEGMAAALEAWPIKAWKAYTHASGPGWYLDGSDGSDLGPRFIRQAAELGVPIIAVHKGFSGGSPFASPKDVGPAARDNPDVSFTIYHSGYEAGQVEGPYDDSSRDVGVNRLITSLRDAGIEPGGNVYAELGSTWRALMAAPEQAAHVLGKLLLHVGEDNVVWGTDSIWYGSPQDQIQALRAFEITAAFQERFGYPALTAERKAKILGLNAARLYGVDPATVSRCDLSSTEREELRIAMPAVNSTFGPRTRAQVLAHQRAHDYVVAV
jgi:predicted TIM-barrel fold metal-dependent hydrolase